MIRPRPLGPGSATVAAKPAPSKLHAVPGQPQNSREGSRFRDSDWCDWRWQAQHAVTDLQGLDDALTLNESERVGAARAMAAGLPISVTPYYLALCDPLDPDCPIRRQCIPRLEEAIAIRGDLRDPLGEQAHEVAPHLIQRYPDRVLLIATDRCGVYCRFCTRSRLVGDGGGARSMAALEPALAWIEAHPEVHDVIVSGGDPCLMSTGRIARLLRRIREIEHVDYVRLATRTPVTLPQRITDELCTAIRESHERTWVMTHFNHPKELSEEARTACARLADAGLPIMNQTVLLRGVNDDPQTLEALFRGLVGSRVRPYYLLQMDPVSGTGHLRTPLRRGIELMAFLQGRLSGIALPKLIVDTPGGLGKVPIGPNYIRSTRDGVTVLETFRGDLVQYYDPAEN
ncbi:MAG: KamA family radical SAM protein [Deltaproteobacteria bacterium]|nr:KamA family radical SAM protein [Deltaproteobacteria bacterium]NND28633.1 KamA family radical SAM protein [Myxococcales bacterium]MBT8463191.1 KamA family radical SAM protein [Deltaproteobacteria bacterium]MBT8481329.1 KamA family radical SAM protein [Deltaproteobacteria bacterium]NNK44853.1 KamA family radical SAM protein [Myxococcales bacterium]